ncbi:MAG: hypothetical protein KAI66_15015 [Lentisphaeria bacterium]|nr:hypothetical protein [Lentisphaeria bacterium]
MRRFLPLLAMFLAPALLGLGIEQQSLSPEQVSDLYTQAKACFRKGNELVKNDPNQAREQFRMAVLRFERIVREGDVENGRLYYNIGNTYFRMGDVGRALLNYRRAERYIPNDLNLQQNLANARSRRTDRVEESEGKRILRTVLFWHYDFSMGQRARAFAVLHVLFWCLCSLRLFKRISWVSWSVVLCGLPALLLAASLASEAMHEARVRPGVVLAREAIAYKGDADTYEKAFTEPLHAGTEFVVIEDRGQWIEIQLADRRTCWLPAGDIGMVRGTTPDETRQ